jgi:hypothetical protein
MMQPTKIEIRDFVSPFAVYARMSEEHNRKRRAEAADYVRQGMVMHVGPCGVWSGSFPDQVSENSRTSRSVSSYERLGYHNSADQFLLGFLLAGGKVIFHGFKGIKGEVTL